MSSAKIVLITGANTGFGLAMVKGLLEAPSAYHVLLGSRSIEKGQAAVESLRKELPDMKNTVEPLKLDITSDEDISHAVEHVQTTLGRLDVLVNNAGIALDRQGAKGHISLREVFTKAYDTNVTSTHVLTYSMIPLLLKSSDPRLLFITGLSAITQAGRQYFPTPPQPAGWPKNVTFETIGYRCTKCALNMLMLDWNHKLKADGVKVWAVAPGLAMTGLGGGNFTEEELEINKMFTTVPTSAGGEIVRDVIEGKADHTTGRYVHRRNGEIVPSEW